MVHDCAVLDSTGCVQHLVFTEDRSHSLHATCYQCRGQTSHWLKKGFLHHLLAAPDVFQPYCSIPLTEDRQKGPDWGLGATTSRLEIQASSNSKHLDSDSILTDLRPFNSTGCRRRSNTTALYRQKWSQTVITGTLHRVYANEEQELTVSHRGVRLTPVLHF